MKKFVATLLLLLGVFLMTANVAWAQGPSPGSTTTFSGAAVGAGIGAAVTILGAGIGFGKIGAAALESMARQPEKATQIQIAMIIIAALLEGATFFALIVCFQLISRATF
jgi:F-type H+-transporting ATPase subunit c